MAGSSKVVTLDEVAKHNTAEDCWVIIDGFVYDLSSFLDLHPGGRGVILPHAGKDATEIFYSLHRTEHLQQYAAKLLVGRLPGVSTQQPQFPSPGHISKVPYAESSSWQHFKSPYFTPQHIEFRSAVRAFIQKELVPHGAAFENSGKDPPLELYRKMGTFGLLACRMGPAVRPWLEAFNLPGGVTAQQFDYFHEMIAHEEIARTGYSGFTDSLGAGLVIGLPPVVLFGSEDVKKQVVMPVLRGEKRIALAISEPFAGSDVSNIRTTAQKSPCGKYYIVNGVKKWITNGTFADYFATAVRTGGPGIEGISLLLVERGPGVSTKKIQTAYGGCAGTAYVEFENVQVPIGNLLGKENDGFKCIMANFNHERWLIVVGVLSATRFVIEECMKWAHQREVFGEKLIQKPVIRQKLGAMIAQLEAAHNWTENITYQMQNMSLKDQNNYLAGPIALLKYQATKVADFISTESCQIFGGRALTKTGMGRIVTYFRTSQKFGAILGGSEEIMCDLGVRQAMRLMPLNARL